MSTSMQAVNARRIFHSDANSSKCDSRTSALLARFSDRHFWPLTQPCLVYTFS